MRRDREPECEICEKFTHDCFFSVPGPKLERQLQQIDEQSHTECGHRDSSDQALHPAHFGGAENRDHECRKCGRDQTQWWDRHKTEMNTPDHARESKDAEKDP